MEFLIKFIGHVILILILMPLLRYKIDMSNNNYRYKMPISGIVVALLFSNMIATLCYDGYWNVYIVVLFFMVLLAFIITTIEKVIKEGKV